MKKYRKYKTSGVEWIGEIPENWKFAPIKHYSESKTGTTPSRDNEEYWSEGTIPWMSSGEINQKQVSIISEFVTEKAFKETSLKLFPINTVMIAMNGQGKTKGTVGILETETTCNQSLTGFMFNDKVNPKFVYRYLDSRYYDIRGLVGEDREGLSSQLLKNLFIPLPSPEEQTQIANYLDYKTKEIETLISNKQKLIELLQEERTATINQAVTKGVPSNLSVRAKSRTKPSGIEWLGDIPEHWEVKKLKFLLKETRDSLKTGPFGSHLKNSDLIENGEVKVYTQRNVLDNNFDSGEDFIDLEKYETLKGFTVEPNDILITTRGTIGRCSEFPNDKQIGILHPCLIRIQVDVKKANPKWIMNYINNTSYFPNNVKYNSNSTIIDVIYGYTLKEIVFPVPPLNEQSVILKYIVDECFRVDTIITKTEQEIELLKEYKTALISEVVTGKVDVRDEVIPK